MKTTFELSKFFGQADANTKTKVLLHICEHNESVLVRAIQATSVVTWEQEAEALLRDGKKIIAIKVCRGRTGWSLKDAKDAVEALQKELGL